MGILLTVFSFSIARGCRSPEDHFLVEGRSALAKGNSDRAEELLTEAIKRNPNASEAYLLRGTLHHSAGQFADALGDLLKAKELAPSRFHADLALAECFFETGETEAAVHLAAEILTKDPSTLPALVLKAKALFLEKQFAAALVDCDVALIQQPNSRDVQLLRALALFQLARYPEAQDELSRLISKNPTDAYAYWIRAQVEAKLDHLDESESDRFLAAQIDPSLGIAEAASSDAVFSSVMNRLSGLSTLKSDTNRKSSD